MPAARQNLVRFPFSAEWYYELQPTGAVHLRADVAFAMTEPPRYLTLRQPTAFTVQEIDRALAQ